MGLYLNPGNKGFQIVRRGTYVDKSGMIALLNRTISTPQMLTCVSRPRRFGKSFAAKMLCAYYDRSCDSSELFDDLEIAKDISYQEHRNQYDVIYLDITNIMAEVSDRGKVVSFIKKHICEELCEQYPGLKQSDSFSKVLVDAVELSGRPFIAIIDEWDAMIRDRKTNTELQWEYLEFLRMLFKSSGVTERIFAAAYMTGILPIKKDGSQSAISEFQEYSMLSPGAFAPYVGFTEQEVQKLCEKSFMDFGKMKEWYDGYSFCGVSSIYNPNSVMEAIYRNSFQSYWKMSAAADSLLSFINMDFDGLSKAVYELLGGVSIPVIPDGFQNDMISFMSKEDVLTILIHFGYLSYNEEEEAVRIPNDEIRAEFARSIRKVKHTDTIRRIQESERLIEDTIAMNEEAVAGEIEKIHREECSPLFYNNEQSLRSVVKLAYFIYRDYYVKMEELPGGKGYADIVFLPKRSASLPILVVELKWNQTADGAIKQIKDRDYPSVWKDFGSEILLVGISYNKEDGEKKHHCRIEKYIL